MRYTADQRVWVEMYGVQCWVIPGREIISSYAAPRARRAQPAQPLLSAVVAYLERHDSATYKHLAAVTGRGAVALYELVRNNPDLFVLRNERHGTRRIKLRSVGFAPPPPPLPANRGALACLVEYGPATIPDLAARMGKNPKTVHMHVYQLCDEGLTERVDFVSGKKAARRRLIIWGATDKGRQTAQNAPR